MPKRDNSLLLNDIQESGLKIQRYVLNLSFEQFQNDELRIDAVIRNFEIIGEAARNLSPEFIAQNTTISWGEIIGYRNLLIHQYFGVSLQAVWNIIQDDLPALITSVGLIMENRN